MLTTQSPPAGRSPAASAREPVRRSVEPPILEASIWQGILQQVRAHHPGLNRTWFDEMVPRQLTNGVIQVTVATQAQLNFCQNQCQQPFTNAAQQVTNLKWRVGLKSPHTRAQHSIAQHIGF